ncbi:CNPV162 TGF-beta-like protein [Canarypox virus]|uniref:CNPV162 TGF-beta-like protein n=1 Tax=Canarypox virus TaxID=44088 RepID=Q6VZI5_CNPV|nr:CNPV162 TGF-beta-like protein [Canarypox virus]AAR83508.1 CNPV162 TGF-beta-like protein [Canarypox virus]AWD84638.1 TGF-beta-like protein [Canarypox virus]
MVKIYIWVYVIISYCYANSDKYINSTDFKSKISELVKRDIIYKKYVSNIHQHVCSLNSVYLDFSALGYKWIHEPKGIQFTYCHGTCILSSYDKSSVIYGTIVTNYLSNNRIPLCCSPKERKDITITYYLGRNVKKQTIRNFIPTHCGCG